MPVDIGVDAEIERIRLIEMGADPGAADAGYEFLYSKNPGVYAQDDAATVYRLHNYTEGARVYNNANININNITETALTFNSEVFDTDGIHSVIANTSRLTCQTAGKYVLIGSLFWNTSGAGTLRQANFRLNGVTRILSNNEDFISVTWNASHILVTEYDLSVTDYVELTVYQNTGGALSVRYLSAYSPFFMMQRIG